MEICIFTEPQQGASYDEQLAQASAAERLGFHGWFRSDHFLAMGAADGLPAQSLAWGLWLDGEGNPAGLASGLDRIQQARAVRGGRK